MQRLKHISNVINLPKFVKLSILLYIHAVTIILIPDVFLSLLVGWKRHYNKPSTTNIIYYALKDSVAE